jgi:CheY-specific phosphatase CheX
MPEISIEAAISRATADVLEKMFFTGFAAESEWIQDSGPRIAVRLAFDGERQGLLTLVISRDSARTLAADFLGTDTADGPDEMQVNEVVRELANMICGNALSTLEKRALRLSAPEILRAAELGLPEGSAHRSFDLNGGTLAIGLVFHGVLDA